MEKLIGISLCLGVVCGCFHAMRWWCSVRVTENKWLIALSLSFLDLSR